MYYHAMLALQLVTKRLSNTALTTDAQTDRQMEAKLDNGTLKRNYNKGTSYYMNYFTVCLYKINKINKKNSKHKKNI